VSFGHITHTDIDWPSNEVGGSMFESICIDFQSKTELASA
jgi:hypothetical protein